MPGSLSHSVANVVAQLLVDLDHCTAPASDGSWPVYATREPDRPDDCVTVYNTTGIIGGRDTPTNERAEYNGFQVRIRGNDHETAYAKALAIALAFDSSVSKKTVTVSDRTGTGTSQYTVWSIKRTSDVLSLGAETPTSRRSVFTLNATISLRE